MTNIDYEDTLKKNLPAENEAQIKAKRSNITIIGTGLITVPLTAYVSAYYDYSELFIGIFSLIISILSAFLIRLIFTSKDNFFGEL